VLETGGATFAQIALRPRQRQRHIERAEAQGRRLQRAIQRHACTGCGVHMYGRIENKNHPFFGFDFVHTELSKERGWAAPEFGAFVSSIMSPAFPAQMGAVRATAQGSSGSSV